MSASPLKSVSATKGAQVPHSTTHEPEKHVSPPLSQAQGMAPAGVLAQPYSPWKENIYLVENDRRALERDIRRTKNRMEGDLKAVLEQSRRGRGDPIQNTPAAHFLTHRLVAPWINFFSKHWQPSHLIDPPYHSQRLARQCWRRSKLWRQTSPPSPSA